MGLLDWLTLLGGLAFFLYGMSVMSSGLEKLAGGKLEATLQKVTRNPLMSFTLGAGITIAIQSSSAMTVMLVGLVNSGIMSFEQTIGVILGSNVGTTLTAWILSLMGIDNGEFSLINLLSPEYFSPVVALIGAGLLMFAKKAKKREVGTIFLGFAILMYGMQFMSNSVAGVREMPEFNNLLTAFSNPVTAVLISAFFTGIIQSSAATVGIIQALALTNAINYKMAIPLVLGANIGTCMTALLSSIGTSRDAKRVVAAHTYIKIFGTVFCLALMAVFASPLSAITSRKIDAVGVAVVHTLFNVLNTLIIYPVKPLLVKLCKMTVKGKEKKEENEVLLDERLINTPPIAVEECRRLTADMAVAANAALNKAIVLLKGEYSEEKLEEIYKLETLTDKYEDTLGTFLVRVSSKDLSESDSSRVGQLLHTIGDLERIGDHAENIGEVAKEMHYKGIAFSPEAIKEIAVMTSAVLKITDITVESFCADDAERAKLVEPLEQVIDELKIEVRNRHIDRVKEQMCTMELGFVFSDLITNYERISDHCSNIAVYTIQLHGKEFDTHKYLNSVKNGENEEFKQRFASFEEEYKLPKR